MKTSRTGAHGIKDQLGDRLRELRAQAGLSQGEAADACGISRVFYGTLERAVKAATVETLEKLARGFRVRPDQLLALEEPHGDSPADRLGRRVAQLARAASADKLATFERLARAYFSAGAEKKHARRR